jgi:hypothetical protein
MHSEGWPDLSTRLLQPIKHYVNSRCQSPCSKSSSRLTLLGNPDVSHLRRYVPPEVTCPCTCKGLLLVLSLPFSVFRRTVEAALSHSKVRKHAVQGGELPRDESLNVSWLFAQIAAIEKQNQELQWQIAMLARDPEAVPVLPRQQYSQLPFGFQEAAGGAPPPSQ